MVSLFLREQKRYTQEKLCKLFKCSEERTARILKRLKEFGAVKSVKAIDVQKDMTELFEADVVVNDVEIEADEFFYVFSFVGIIVIEGIVIKCCPKYLVKTENPKKELTQILKVLEKYSAKEQIVQMLNENNEERSSNLLAVWLFLMYDYYESGVYNNTQEIIESNGSGEILWDRTINETFTLLSGNRPFYTELQTRKRVNDEYDYFKRLSCIKTFDPQANSAYEDDLDVYKTLLWELFICVIAYLRHVKDYAAINVLITYTYFLENNIFGGAIKQANYTTFRHHSVVIEERYKPMSEMKNKYTLVGDVVCNQREKLPIYTTEAIAEADLFLYQVCNAYDLVENEQAWYRTCWFPTCYVYAQNKSLEWERMKSRRYCEKMEVLFGVDCIEKLKEKIEKCVYDSQMRYSGGWGAAPAILSCIKVEDIGTLS